MPPRRRRFTGNGQEQPIPSAAERQGQRDGHARDHEQQLASDRRPVTPQGAEALRAYAARQRSSADQLATFLEDVAANGRPAPGSTTPWDVVRDRRLAELSTARGHVA
ncbi:hypothetical protein [Streptomyces sp. 769]|uniref:hypothetical protein n=1 Tax=Streptomyces sp. 769 TaxID=1262452 RepID=UPI0005820681|nr:hypothetical protein [Streptomyces sp. 769]AJC62058.1 hypothetical protein GZL_p00128 [Streptomyces sp. 769]